MILVFSEFAKTENWRFYIDISLHFLVSFELRAVNTVPDFSDGFTDSSGFYSMVTHITWMILFFLDFDKTEKQGGLHKFFL